jgi:hypothetical protein
MGLEEAGAQPDRPLTDEIAGDPRTAAGESYPDETKRVDRDQRPPGETLKAEPAED